MANKIYGNTELTNLKVKIERTLNKFTSELESINNEHNPELNRLKKRKDNIVYYTVLTLFLMLIISIGVFLRVIEAFYLILLLYGINLLLTGAGVFLYIKVQNQYVVVKSSYDKQYKALSKYQDEVNELYKEAEKEVYKVIALTKYHEELENLKGDNEKYKSLLNEKITEVTKNIQDELKFNYSSEAVLAYYEEWGKSLTEGDSKFDFLEERRRKAIIRSTNIDIDSKGE